MGRRPNFVALGLGILLSALAAAPGPAQPGDRDARIQALLEERAAAVGARDAAAFLQTVDPEAGAFRQAQSAWFERQGELPIAGYSLRLRLDRLGELTRERDRARYGVPVVVASVEERFAIEGFDERPASNDLFYTFVLRDGRWAIASDADLDDLGLFTTRQPWDFGPIDVRSSDHFLMVVHPDKAAEAPDLLRQAEEALADVDRVWRRPWSKRVPIFVPSTKRELEKMLAATFDVTNFVAFAVASVEREGGFAFTGNRIVLNPDNFLRRTPSSRHQILAHELFHVATRGAGGPFVANFVEEGFAELAGPAGGGGTAFLDGRIRAGRFDRKLPQDLDFTSGDGSEIFLAYQKALSAFSYLRQRYGIEAVNRFYETFGAARVEPGTSRYHLDRSLQEAFGVSTADFERDWASWAVARAS